ncbi:lipase precursor [Staphylococcus argenteus]|uniref:YSIRK-targeted triacylglycerol lipase n=1 Tax=Staphylococcus argenteus TaxID=985002 RepID=UPI00091D3F36|nr:triacylglycerol lipase [Staphylococcus argenteus]SHD50413.1 lipase precursor [Staphylococcus argenteus]SHD51017.1 lipase precursor [Staphylococcus argenteus]SHD53615.1 lipase precursor [Staphylococcus argenteus]
MIREQERRKYSIRKYSIGVVSVLAATVFVVSTHDAKAAEKMPTSLSGTQQEKLNQSGEHRDIHRLQQDEQSLRQLNDAHKIDSESQIGRQANDALQSSKQQPTKDDKTDKSQNNNKVTQNADQQNVKQLSKDNSNKNTKNQDAIKQNDSRAEQDNSKSNADEKEVDKSQPSVQTQISTTQDDKATSASTTPSSKEKTTTASEVQDASTNKNVNQQDTHPVSQQIKDAKQDDAVRQRQDKPLVNDLSKHNNTQNSPIIPTDKNTDNQRLIKDALLAPKTRATTKVATADAKKIHPLKANQVQPLNKYPVVFVHGFLGLVGDNAPALYPNYWGGNKFKVIEELKKQGYNVHQASVGAFSSNHDRAVELYYYIKGGRVDYGAAHAAKYGHERYGKTYKGIMPDWEPGKKVHLVGHSMGGQTIRLMEEFLRNGNQEEIAYHKAHGGEISPLFVGGKNNMVASITTLGTPHNGSQAADKFGNTETVRRIMYALNRIAGNKYSNIDLGLTQWGFKQLPNESYIDYMKRVGNSKIWTTTDNAAYDLTLDGSAKLNAMTSMNPNITYTTYTGVSSHTGPLGYENPDIGTFFLMDATSRIIGHDAREEWRKNDGVVPVISSLHPSNQPFVNVTSEEPATRRGIWQVKPILQGWDHVDFIGIDFADFKRKGAELANFYTGIINDLLRVEATDEKGAQLKAS